jgi:hypothetical protein
MKISVYPFFKSGVLNFSQTLGHICSYWLTPCKVTNDNSLLKDMAVY